jgi:hypothetical protein
MNNNIKKGAFEWTSRGEIKFRIERIFTDEASVWISHSSVNLYIPLVMHDFMEHCDSVGLNIEVDLSWKGKKGFKVKGNDINSFLDEVAKFIDEWDISPSENVQKISDEEWFSNEKDAS